MISKCYAAKPEFLALGRTKAKRQARSDMSMTLKLRLLCSCQVHTYGIHYKQAILLLHVYSIVPIKEDNEPPG